MKELPVNWQEIDGSKVDLARDSIAMAIDLVVTRLAYLLEYINWMNVDELTRRNNNRNYRRKTKGQQQYMQYINK